MYNTSNQFNTIWQLALGRKLLLITHFIINEAKSWFS